MKRFFLALLCIVCGLKTSAFAIERVSIEDWAKSWTKTYNDKKSTTFSTASLEKTVLNPCSDCEQKLLLDKARDLHASGKYQEAISSYDKISKGSAYWFLAVEEKGWAYFQMENYQKAIAQSKTLLAPSFAEVVNPEAYLLQSLSLLKICDYKSLFETHQTFKEKQKQRILAVEELAKTGWNESLGQLLKNANKLPLTLEEVGESSLLLPIMAYKDREFQKQIARFKASEKVLEFASGLNERIRVQIEKIQHDAFENLKSRLQNLAQNEARLNSKLIQKLNLVEVEAIQRIHTDLNLEDKNYQRNKFSQIDSDKLMFVDDGKPWLDELDQFEVATRACKKGIRRKM